MNKNVLIIGGIVLAVVLTLPLALTSGDGMGVGSGHEPGDRFSDYQLPEYAQRMGLNRVRLEVFNNTRGGSHEVVAEQLGVPGVRIDHPDQLPPMEWFHLHDQWVRTIEDPDKVLYFWVNENDQPVMMSFGEEGFRMRYAGERPERFQE